MFGWRLVGIFVVAQVGTVNGSANKFMSQLYEDLLYSHNPDVVPNKNATGELMVVRFGSALIRIIRVDEVNQMLTTNLWLDIQWHDSTLMWQPEDYGGIWKIHMPVEYIWTPDIVLYNAAKGDYEITSDVHAVVYFDGRVVWKPPAIYTSFCKIHIKYFPYDVQTCDLKFGGWTYHGAYMDMQQLKVDDTDVIHIIPSEDNKEPVTMSLMGMDLSFYQRSVVWDLVNLTSQRNSVVYPGCCGAPPYIDVTFWLTLRRKTLFYTSNLIIPSMLVAVLTTFVFYIPSADHKITFAISILFQQTVFYNIMMDILPPSSDSLPLFAQYLLFTVVLVFTSILISVVTINLYRRNGSTHIMPFWMRVIFLELLPPVLFLKPWEPTEIVLGSDASRSPSVSTSVTGGDPPNELLSWHRRPSLGKRYSVSIATDRRRSPYFMSVSEYLDTQTRLTRLASQRNLGIDTVQRMIANVQFIGNHYRALEEEARVSDEWSYVAMVIDRVFFVFFTIVNLVGTILIINQAPPDDRPAWPLEVRPTKPLGAETHSGWYIATYNFSDNNF